MTKPWYIAAVRSWPDSELPDGEDEWFDYPTDDLVELRQALQAAQEKGKFARVVELYELRSLKSPMSDLEYGRHTTMRAMARGVSFQRRDAGDE